MFNRPAAEPLPAAELFRIAKVRARDLARRRERNPGKIGPSGIKASDELWLICKSLGRALA